MRMVPLAQTTRSTKNSTRSLKKRKPCPQTNIRSQRSGAKSETRERVPISDAMALLSYYKYLEVAWSLHVECYLTSNTKSSTLEILLPSPLRKWLEERGIGK